MNYADKARLIGLIDELSVARFYGSLELKWEAGRVVLIRKTETIKSIGTTKEVDDAPNNRRLT